MHRRGMDTSTLPTQTSTDGTDPTPSVLQRARKHHHERHVAASHGLEVFFANLTILLGSPLPIEPPAPRTDEPRP